MFWDSSLFPSATLALLTATFAFAQPVSRLVYGTYLDARGIPAGVDGTPASISVAVDPQGNTIVSRSETRLVYIPNCCSNHVLDLVLAKISADGQRRFSTTVQNAVPTAMAVDAASNIYVCGIASGGFRTTPGVFQPSSGDGFVAKFDPTGNLLWASRIAARPYALAVDASGAVYLTGTAKSDFESTAGVVQPAMAPQECSVDQYGSTLRSCTDAFAAKISADGTRLVFATLLGGTREELGYAIAVDASARVWVAGETYSEDFPTTPGAYQRHLGGAPSANNGRTSYIVGGDAFLAELDPGAGKLLYATYLGGAGADFASGIAVDRDQNVYVTGTTASPDFPVTANAYQGEYGGPVPTSAARAGDAFFAKWSGSGEPQYISYSGGAGAEMATGAVLGPEGQLDFLQATANPAPCRPSTSILVLDTATGQITDREGVVNLAGWNANLAIDAAGIIHTAGVALESGDPLAVTDRSSNGSLLVALVDFKRQDEFAPACAVNAASFTSHRRFGGAPLSVAPGEIVSIFGAGVGPAPSLTLDGRELTVLYADANQINASIPYDLGPGSSTLTLERGPYRASYPVEVSGVFPGIFTLDGVHAAALNEDGTVNAAQNPAPRGSVVALFATGLGPLNAGGRLATEFGLYIQAPTSTNATGVEILYAGPAPGLPVGAYQVNARVPLDATPGEPLIRFAFGPPWFELSQDDVRIFVEP